MKFELASSPNQSRLQKFIGLTMTDAANVLRIEEKRYLKGSFCHAGHAS
jgi:hypothetical protein